jgi:hypothetical protein
MYFPLFLPSWADYKGIFLLPCIRRNAPAEHSVGLPQAATGLRFACRSRSVGGLLVVLHILCWREIIVNKGISL